MQDILSLYGYQKANIGKLYFKTTPVHIGVIMSHIHLTDTLILSDEIGCYDDAYIKWIENQNHSQIDRSRINIPPASPGAPISVHTRYAITPYVFDGDEDLTYTDSVANQTVEFLRQRQNESFFCISGFYAPHSLLNLPRWFFEMYDTNR